MGTNEIKKKGEYMHRNGWGQIGKGGRGEFHISMNYFVFSIALIISPEHT
jgi:hypothetical protein